MDGLVKKINTLSQSVSQSCQDVLKEHIDGGKHSIAEAVAIAQGGVLGAMTVMASIVGLHDKREPTLTTTNEAFLFTALLVVAMNKVMPPQSGNPNAVGIETDYGPMPILEAIENYTKLMGKKPDGFVTQGMLDAAREFETKGVNVADDLLRAVCANQKPA